MGNGVGLHLVVCPHLWWTCINDSPPSTYTRTVWSHVLLVTVCCVSGQHSSTVGRTFDHVQYVPLLCSVRDDIGRHERRHWTARPFRTRHSEDDTSFPVTTDGTVLKMSYKDYYGRQAGCY